jgi:hypothetical protein
MIEPFPADLEELARCYEAIDTDARDVDVVLCEMIGWEVQRRDPPFQTTCRRYPSQSFADAEAVVPVCHVWTVQKVDTRRYWAAVEHENEPLGETREGSANSPARALTAAALRCRHDSKVRA